MLKLVYLLLVSLFLGQISAEKLRIGILQKVANCERKTQAGDVIHVHYTGRLKESGQVFDSSLNRGIPFEFPLGKGHVIKGWDQGMLGMCVGEKRKLTIPPELGYGSQGAGGVIPPGATLVFTTELIAIDGYEPPADEKPEKVEADTKDEL